MIASPSGQAPAPVNVMNFARAESDTYFYGLAGRAGGTNRWYHFREPTPIEDQTVIRMNRDTLYSSIIVDLSDAAALTVPDAKGRYQSAMVVDQDHYIERVFDQQERTTWTREPSPPRSWLSPCGPWWTRRSLMVRGPSPWSRLHLRGARLHGGVSLHGTAEAARRRPVAS